MIYVKMLVANITKYVFDLKEVYLNASWIFKVPRTVTNDFFLKNV